MSNPAAAPEDIVVTRDNVVMHVVQGKNIVTCLHRMADLIVERGIAQTLINDITVEFLEVDGYDFAVTLYV